MKVTRKIVLAIAIIFCILVGLAVYHEYPISNFCADIPLGSDVGAVLDSAKEEGFFIDNYKKFEQGTLVIHNHPSPFFRIGCILEIEDSRVVSKLVIGTD